MMLSLLLKSSDWIVVDKPAGVSVHNTEAGENLIDWLGREFKGATFFPVHRLDKETSGVQIMALNSKKAAELAQLFQDRSVRKVYRGILRGRLILARPVWDWPLTDKAEGRKNPQGVSRERLGCETRVQILKESTYFTECEFDLLTGRQHQIRKHAALAGHPLVGDNRYGDTKYNQKMAEIYPSRMYLHCSHVEIAGQVLEAPIPSEFAKLIRA